MKKFQALLNKRWTGSQLNTNTIFGEWAEDGNVYEVIAPPQLVNQIVAMQNYMYDMNKEVVDLENNIKQMKEQLELMKQVRGYK